MLKTAAAALKQAFNKGFFTGVAGTVLVLILSSVQELLTAFRSTELLAYGFHASLIMNALSSDAMTLALPIICTLPYTASFVDDIKSGFIKEYLPRTTVNRYLWGKGVACAVSGGLVPALGALAAYSLTALVFSPSELARGADAPAYFAPFLGRVLLFFCSGALWAVVGLAFSAATNSKYMAYAAPFIIYYVLIILYERYFDRLYVLYPKEWLAPSDKWMFGSGGVVLLKLELTAIAGLAFAAAAKRRLAQI